MAEKLNKLMAEISACRICRDAPLGKLLPHEPRPVAVLSNSARIVICGQAPGTRVHASGIPFSDPSGDRLRDWMGVTPTIFYDASKIAIVPMGFCFPGLDAKGGDLPPRRECAPQWRKRVFAAMPQVQLMLCVGQYAQKWHLGPLAHASLTATVANWQEIAASTSYPQMLPLPHPSWRNNAWIAANSWFSTGLLPFLKERVQQAMDADL